MRPCQKEIREAIIPALVELLKMRLKSFPVLILIALALPLIAVKSADGEPSGKQNTSKVEISGNDDKSDVSPVVTAISQSAAEKRHRNSDRETYNYNGNFNFIPPVRPPESKWAIVGDIASVVSAVLVAFFTGLLFWVNLKLVGVTDEMRRITGEATKAASASAKAAELALNAERPYAFLEKQDITIALRVLPSIATLPCEWKVDQQTSEIGINFCLRNRGKGVAIIDSVQAKMIVGGLLTKDKPETIGRRTTDPRMRFMGSGETTKCSIHGFLIANSVLSRIADLELGLTIFVSVRYSDVFRRSFTMFVPLDYNPPLKGPDGQLLHGPFLAQHRRSRYS